MSQRSVKRPRSDSANVEFNLNIDEQTHGRACVLKHLYNVWYRLGQRQIFGPKSKTLTVSPSNRTRNLTCI